MQLQNLTTRKITTILSVSDTSAIDIPFSAYLKFRIYKAMVYAHWFWVNVFFFCLRYLALTASGRTRTHRELLQYSFSAGFVVDDLHVRFVSTNLVCFWST